MHLRCAIDKDELNKEWRFRRTLCGNVLASYTPVTISDVFAFNLHLDNICPVCVRHPDIVFLILANGGSIKIGVTAR